MNDKEFYGESYEVMKQTEGRLLKLIELYETEKEKEQEDPWKIWYMKHREK